MRAYLAVLVLALLAPLTAADAQSRARHVRPLDQILPQIRRSHPGTFYDAERPYQGPDGRMHYRLKWGLPDGRIVWLDVDAETGRVLGEFRGPRQGYEQRGYERRDDDRRDDGRPDYGRPDYGRRDYGDRDDRRSYDRDGEHRAGESHDWRGRGDSGHDRDPH